MPDSADPPPPEFFANPRCPSAPTAPTTVNVKVVETDLSEVAKDLEEGVVVEEQG